MSFQLAIQLFMSLVIAVVTAIITVFLSLRRFRKEKLWEAKMARYSTLFESLHEFKLGLYQAYALVSGLCTADNTQLDEYEKRHQRAYTQIDRTVTIGELVMSKRATQRLREMLRNMVGRQPLLTTEKPITKECLDREIQSLETAIRDLIPIAQEDLDDARFTRFF